MKIPYRLVFVMLALVGTAACEEAPAPPPPPPPIDDVAMDGDEASVSDVSIDEPAPKDLGAPLDTPDVSRIDRPDVVVDRPATDVPVVTSDVVIRRCMADRDCDDRVACTDDACREGVCANTPRNSRCGDGQWCDLARGCVMGQPCMRDRDCTSANPCETDGFCSPSTGRCVFFVRDDDRDGVASYACGGTDCNDLDAETRPGGRERCNGRDDDCNGTVDEDPERTLCGGGTCTSGACTCTTAGLTFCGGTCVNVMTAREHCGRCNNPCGDAFTCVAGRCQCASTSIACGVETCVNTMTNAAHCGACGRACATTLSCVAGTCGCTAGQTMCSGRCVDTMTDRNNCGMCGRFCSLVPCEGGVCRCPTGQTMCGSLCADLMTDARNCGSCGVSCGVGTCVAGACTCTGTARNCPGAGCVDTTINRSHCGACGNLCRTDQTCTAGACTCFTGSMECDGRCVSVTSDVLNCGACGNACPGGSVLSFCSAGTCMCRSGTRCGTGADVTCADTLNDASHCGACGTRCPATQSCVAGRCACATGTTACGASCVNTTVNVAHCGACGNACTVPATALGAEAVCVGSRCASVCTVGRGECDGNAANGCEVDLRTNRAHCGACGRACAGTAACVDGVCAGDAWVRSTGSTLDDRATRVTSDAASNVYVVGAFSSSVTFGAGSVISAGGNDGFIASVDPRGNPRWIRRAGGLSGDVFNDVAVDARGNVYAVGTVNGAADLGDGVTRAATTANDMIVVSYTNAGTFRWGHRFGNLGDDVGYGIAVDGSGNVYVAGHISAPVMFDTTRVNATSVDGVVVSFTSAGAVRWATHLSGPGTQTVTSIAATATGDTVLTANFDTRLVVGTTMLTAVGGTDAAVIALNPMGSLRWSQTLGAMNTEFLSRVQLDAAGNAVVVGRFDSPTLTLGTQTLTNFGGSFVADALIATYTAAGALRWARNVGGTSTDLGNDAAFDAMGNVWFAGSFRLSADLGMGSVAAVGLDGFLVQYSPTGTVRTAQRYGGSSEDEVVSVRAVPGATLIAGHFTLSTTIGTTALTSLGSRDVFAARLVP